MCLFITICLSGQDWQENYGSALSIAQTEDKPLIVVFAGSDWCGPCKKLEKKIWQSDVFKTYASENYVLYKADFPRKKANQLSKEKVAENGKLAALYNPKGHFPLVVVLNKREDVLGKVGYEKVDATGYLSLLNAFVN